MAKSFPLRQIERNLQHTLRYAPAMLANDALNFFLDRFRQQNWLGNTAQPWKPRKSVTRWGKTPRNRGRAILVYEGILRRSLRVISVSGGVAHIGTNVPYARAHNEGLRLGLIQNVKSYERRRMGAGIVKKKTLKTRSKVKWGRVETGKTMVKAHKRRVNMNIPRRQFMGNSPYLTRQLSRRLQAELMKGLRGIR